MFFCLETFLARSGARPGGASFLRALPGPFDERREPLARSVTVLSLRAMLPAVDDEDSLGRHPAAGQRHQSFLYVVRQRRGTYVEPQLDGRGDFVDVLRSEERRV